MKNSDKEKMEKYGFYNAGEISKNYYILCDFYRETLEQILNELLKINEEEKYLENFISDLKVGKNYYNIYNKIHIERLNLDEINFLINKYNKKEIDEELYNFIKKSFKKVISYNDEDLDSIYYIDDFDIPYKSDTLIYIINYNAFLLQEENFKEKFKKVQSYVNNSKSNVLKRAKNISKFNIDIIVKNK